MSCLSQSHLAKYANRPGPRFKANDVGCRSKVKKGNDGHMYKSKRASNGVYRYVKVSVEARKSKTKKTKSKQKSKGQGKSRK